MYSCIWESSKEKSLRYTRKKPEEAPLYRIVYNNREELEKCWEQVFQHEYGDLSQNILEALDEYLNCGILTSGLALACCESCSETKVIAFSCKRRGLCPSCDAKRSHIFAEHLEQKVLLDEEHRHLVFSIPKRLRVYFRFDRSLSRYLYKAAWDSWKELVQEQLPESNTGAVFSLHSTGSFLDFHPHVHGIAINGGVAKDGIFKSLTEIDLEKLQAMFSEKIFKCLLEEELITEGVIENMRTWKHSGFGVFVGEPIMPKNKDARLFVSRYLKKSPIALSRLEIIEDSLAPIVRLYKSSWDKEDFRDYSPLEFLAKFIQHIPLKWEQTTRYYGIYSARTRGVEKDHPHAILNLTDAKESKKPVSTSWAIWIKKVFEVDPLICPKCGSNMKIKSFVFDLAEIKRITKHACLSDWRAPPSLCKQKSSIEPHIEYDS